MTSAPLQRTLESTVPAAIAGAVQDQVVGRAPYVGTVVAVTITPEAAAAADAVNNRTYRLVNKGQAGVGTTVAATHQTTTGGALVAFDEKALTLGVAGNLVVAEGDVLAADEIVTGTGQAHSGYKVAVDVSRS